VVDLASRGWLVAAGGGAVLVPVDDGFAELGRDGVGGGADVEGQAGRVGGFGQGAGAEQGGEAAGSGEQGDGVGEDEVADGVLVRPGGAGGAAAEGGGDGGVGAQPPHALETMTRQQVLTTCLVRGIFGILRPRDAVLTSAGRRRSLWQDQLREGTKLPERSGTLADDPLSGRQPTSHERLTGLPWDASYREGPAPWDTGRPQPAIVRLASEGGFAGAVLDAGCGTGENALHLASLGSPVLGFDVAETALAIARAKADDRGIEVEFVAADAFQLGPLGRKFETVLDCGLFHTFDRDERPGYVASLASVTEHDGTLYVLCFSDDGPDTGPHPISQEELRAAFNPRTGWHVAAIEPERVQTRYHADGAPAWLATIKRI
jgi:SAM-dependent methyltransferase